MNKQAIKENMCPQGTNVGLDVVSIDPLDWIMDDPRANKHGSRKGTRDPMCKDRYELAWNIHDKTHLKLIIRLLKQLFIR